MFEGDGELTRPAFAFPPFNNVNAFGIAVDFFTIPERIGRKHGFIDQFEERIVQICTVHTDQDGHDFVSEYMWQVEEFSGVFCDGAVWIWANAGPTKVGYSIFPGCVVVFHWMIARGLA